MSHIPNAAMKHAGPTHHDDAPPVDPAVSPASRQGAGRIGTGTWLALGGTLVAGAAAALAVPLLRARAVPVATRRGKPATGAKRKRGKAATK